MRRLILKLCLFLSIFAGLFVFPAWVLYVSGEWALPGRIVKRQLLTKPLLVGLAYSDPQWHTKLLAVRVRKPEIISLGTSRVLEFRDDFFSGSFYNAGIGVTRLANLRKFVEQLNPEEQPKLLIFGMDQKFFNPNWENVPEYEELVRNTNSPTNWVRILIDNWYHIYWDLIYHKKYKISDLTRPRSDGVDRLGMRALVNNAGFRNDGSHQWYWWEDQAGGLWDVSHYKGIYTRNHTLSERGLAEVDLLLSECKARGIYVAGFLPPFSPVIYRALKENKEEFAYIFRSADRLRPIFKRYDFSFEDFTDPDPLELGKDGFVDDQHASEKAYRHIWAVWTEKDSKLRSFSAPNKKTK